MHDSVSGRSGGAELKVVASRAVLGLSRRVAQISSYCQFASSTCITLLKLSRCPDAAPESRVQNGEVLRHPVEMLSEGRKQKMQLQTWALEACLLKLSLLMLPAHSCVLGALFVCLCLFVLWPSVVLILF